MYAVFFIVPVFFPEQLWIVGVICIFLIMLYVTIQQFVYRKMERKNAGRRVLYGWIDEEEDMGEEYEIPIKKISPFDRLSESDQIAVEEFMRHEKSRLTAIGLKEGEIDRFIESSSIPLVNSEKNNIKKKRIEFKGNRIEEYEIENEEEDNEDDEVDEYEDDENNGDDEVDEYEDNEDEIENEEEDN